LDVQDRILAKNWFEIASEYTSFPKREEDEVEGEFAVLGGEELARILWEIGGE